MEETAYSELLKMQDYHWWYQGRRKTVAKILDDHLSQRDLHILDIGSGFGGMLPCLLPYGEVECIEPNEAARQELLLRGVRRIHRIDNFPDEVPPDQYDLATLFDVLEHIERDREVIRNIGTRILRPGGRLLLTVPAHQWLWSSHDTSHHHYRRYTKGRLHALLRSAGLESIKTGYFMTLLFPLALAQRMVDKLYPKLGPVTAVPHPVVNDLLAKVFRLEASGFSFRAWPVGLSLAATAVRPETDQDA